MSAKKILIIPSWYPTDENPYSGIFIKEQIEALHHYGEHITVFYSQIHFELQLAFQKPKLNKQLDSLFPTYIAEGFSFPKRSTYLLNQWAEKNLILFDTYINNEGIPDIIHAHSFIAGYLAMKISKKHSIPYVLTEHYSGLLNSNIDRRDVNIIRKVYQKAKSLIAVSSSLKSEMSLYTTNNIDVIGNMYNDKLFQFSEVKKKGVFTFVTVGGLDDVKNYSLLIDAFSLLVNKNYNVNLVVIGDGTKFNSLKRQIKSLNLSDNILMLGAIHHDNIAGIMEECHCYISSSKVETFGISIVEALAIGLPVVSTDSKGPLDYLDESNSIISKDNTPDSLSDAMSNMISNFNYFDFRSISINIQKRYSAQHICDRIIRLHNR